MPFAVVREMDWMGHRFAPGRVHGHGPTLGSVSVQQFRPRTFQGALDAQNRRKQKVHFASFNLLKAAQMQIGKFGKPFLRQVPRIAFPAHVCTKFLDVDPVFARQWHALLRRNCGLTDTPYSA